MPANDLTIEELTSLERDLSLISNYDQSTNCDSWLCTIDSVDAMWIPLLSKDWRILHIQITSTASVYNSLCREISGVQGAYEQSSISLDGSGEVIAISDTGPDEDHGDFEGRIRSVYSQFGPDNDNSDLLSGHGTHVVVTPSETARDNHPRLEWPLGQHFICTLMSLKVAFSEFTAHYTVYSLIRGIRMLGYIPIAGVHQT